MALELRIDAQANSTSFTFFELTCAYDAVTNDTGWGAPNPLTTDATAATLYITQPKNDTPTDTIDLSTYYPSDSGLGFKIFESTLTDFTGKGKIQDGVWNLEYEVLVDEGGEDPVTYTTSCKFLFDANIKCCLAKRVSQISVTKCDTAFDEETFYLIMIHKAAWAAFCNQEYDRAQTLMDELIRRCGCCCDD